MTTSISTPPTLAPSRPSSTPAPVSLPAAAPPTSPRTRRHWLARLLWDAPVREDRLAELREQAYTRLSQATVTRW
ncbi:hypothetical protein [Specibacter cremeus]|uniref:hypothetical protein n=1 Tax=Specibacter cremeus TaxID=1629051 RepID=UPI000F77A365|nr:hypothetical protein [Specibacter cremeus]